LGRRGKDGTENVAGLWGGRRLRCSGDGRRSCGLGGRCRRILFVVTVVVFDLGVAALGADFASNLSTGFLRAGWKDLAKGLLLGRGLPLGTLLVVPLIRINRMVVVVLDRVDHGSSLGCLPMQVAL